MQKTLMVQIREGQKYSKLWPDCIELAPIFIERRVIKATQLAMLVMPALALISMLVHIQHFGVEYLPQALACSLFFLSLPIQGLMWLGKRSDTDLPPGLAHWYREIKVKMQENGHQPRISSARPKYFELASLLKEMFEKMDRAFTRDMF